MMSASAAAIDPETLQAIANSSITLSPALMLQLQQRPLNEKLDHAREMAKSLFAGPGRPRAGIPKSEHEAIVNATGLHMDKVKVVVGAARRSALRERIEIRWTA